MEEGTLPEPFYKAGITLIPKSENDNTRKENYRPISLKKVDTKILEKILANQITQRTQNLYVTKCDLSLSSKDDSPHTNDSM